MLKKFMAIVCLVASSVSISNAGLVELNKKYAVGYNALQGFRDGAILLGGLTSTNKECGSFKRFKKINFSGRTPLGVAAIAVAIRNTISFIANEKYPGQKEDLKNTSSKAKYLLKKFGPEALYVASVLAGAIATSKCLKKIDKKFFA